MTELRELQLIAKQDCDNPETKPAERAQLMRAYVALEQQRNILRMRPAPKPIDVSDRARAKRKPRATLAPLQATPAQAPSAPATPSIPDVPAS